MAIYKPSSLRDFLNTIGQSPKKSLSQNFLIDGNIIRKIVKTAEVVQGDIVLEIGPGPGSLTEELLNVGASVIAVERDDKMAQALQRLKSSANQLQIFPEDIMDFLASGTLKALIPQGQKLKVVANLPYHITTPIIEKLIMMSDICTSIVVMVQEEVARRFTAKPKTKDYGSFTIFLEFYTNASYAFKVNRTCFYPAPKVDSAIVRLDIKQPEQVANSDAFFILTRSAFQQRRKMLRGSLKKFFSTEEVEQALVNIGCNPQARPEDLSLKQFIALFEILPDAQKKLLSQ